VRAVGRSLLALTKPRIIELLLVTTVPTMMLAARGLPAAGLLMVTLVGGALAAGSANAINCYLDRDIDAVMRRTSRRPLARPAPLAVIRPAEALAFGIALGVAATVMLGLLANWLSAALADAAIVFYVFVYTLGLKRRTASNIVIGGAAGCFPVLVGWAAVTGTVGVVPVILFAVIFFWTPPHFWALAMKFKDDYAAARVPMLPVGPGSAGGSWPRRTGCGPGWPGSRGAPPGPPRSPPRALPQPIRSPPGRPTSPRGHAEGWPARTPTPRRCTCSTCPSPT
jgi:protoheme IX farnesyltransferase